MITFITHFPFVETAKRLDYRRLGKQRLEAKQLINLLWRVRELTSDIPQDQLKTTFRTLARADKSLRYLNHPITRMWYNYELALMEYYNTIVKEWIRRGYKNTMPLYNLEDYDIKYPAWTMNENFHITHRQMLVYKELSRAEKPWYTQQVDFMTYYSPSIPKYIWPN